MLTSKRLLIGAGLTALLVGGVAPFAHAEDTGNPDAAVCSTSDSGTVGTGGEGIILAGAGDNALTCSYTASGLTATYLVQSLNAVTIDVAHPDGTTTNFLDKPDTAAGGGDPVVEGTFPTQDGDIVTLTAASACDPSGGACGASVEAVVGGS